MPNSSNLTVDSFTKLWESKLLPSIRAEFKSEFAILRAEMKKLSSKIDEIESSQQWLSSEYESLKKVTQTTKKQVADANKSIKELDDRLRSREDDIYSLQTALDNLQQYSRRDCIEINGIPAPTQDDPKRLAIEVGVLLGIEDIQEHDISTAHRLPPTKRSKDRIIVKFVRRDMREKFYNSRGKLFGKLAKDIPLISETNTIGDSKIFINESLTKYRKRLFGRINEFKRTNKWKYIWTVNGKICLRQSENSTVYNFSTSEQFEEFLG
jgi:outer membrane murein-binding lipoprotein Lpp